MALLDTHTYDPYISARGNVLNIVAEQGEKEKIFNELKTKIKEYTGKYQRLKPTAENAVRLILTNPQGNSYGKSMKAEDLLYLVCKKIKSEDTDMLIEQLSDIVTSGSCPAGRVNRLMQLVDGLYEL